MTKMLRRPIAFAAFVAMGLLATSARADLNITVEEVDTSTSTIIYTNSFSAAGLPTSNLSTGSFGFSTPDYAVTFLGAQADQLPSISEVLSSTVSVVYNGATGNPSADQLQISITGTLFTAPVTPPDISALSHIGGTFSTASAGDFLNLTSSVIPAVFASPPGFTPQTSSVSSPGSFKNDQGQSIIALSGPFTIQEVLTIQLNGNGDTVGYQSSTTLNSVPEPSSLVLAGLGGLGLIGYGLRRRRSLSV